MTYEVRFSAAAKRDLAQVPPRVLPAVVEFAFGDLARSPQRVGKPLQREFLGTWSARRGPYRVLYRIDDDRHQVWVLRVAHRGEALRPA